MDEKKTGRFGAILAIAAIVSACSATGSRSEAGGSAAQETNYVAKAEPEEEQLICRREQPTGSRISERICLTAEDWYKIEQQSQEMLNRTTRKAQQYEDQ
jgi:hypothetical protein